MAQLTRAAFEAAVTTLLADNTAGGITAGDLQTLFGDLEDSVTWHDEAGGSGGLVQEQVEDITAAQFATGTHQLISFSYNDASGAISATVDSDLAQFSNVSTGFINASEAPVQSVAGLTDAIAASALVTALDAVQSDTTGVSGAVQITNMMKVTQAQYDAIGTPDANTLYLIEG